MAKSNKKYHYVYCITNVILDKHYIGIRSCNINPVDDLGKKYFSSSTDKSFIEDQKTNIHNYAYEVIKIFKSRDDALLEEIRLHNLYDVGKNNNFYNKSKQTSVGFDTSGCVIVKDIYENRFVVPIDDERIKTGEFVYQMIGHKFSEETKKNMSIAQTGEKNGFYGKTHSDETKEILSTYRGEKAYMYGKNHSDETKKKISLIKTGQTHSDETKKKISDSLKGKMTGEKNPFYGKKHSDETKKKISLNNGAKTKKVKIDNIIYDSLKLAYTSLSISVSTLYNRLKSDKYPNYEYYDLPFE